MTTGSSSRPLRAALISAVALVVAACGAGPSPSSGDAAGPPQSGGALRFAVSSDQGCLDPQQVGSNDSIYSLRQIVDSLTDQDPKTGEIKPWLATAWQVAPDAKSYTFTLRSGVTFADGTALDANAVKANFDRVPQLGVRGQLPKGYLAGYSGTTVSSPTQFTVAFNRPNVQFLQGTSTHSLGILSTATVAKSDDERCAAVVGSGPFTVEEYVKNASLTLARRPGYNWGSTLFTHPGEAYLDTVEFRIVPESGVRAGSLASGEVDAIGSIGQQDEAPLQGAGAQLLARPNPGIVFGIGFNLAQPIVADPAVREALSLAIDRKEVVGAVYTSQTRPATSVLASTTPSYVDDSADVAFDAAKAKSVLDAAGWTPGADGIRTRAGQRLSIPLSFANNAGTNKPTLELLQQQAKAVGIDVAVKEFPIAQFPTIQASGDFVAIWGNLTRADPDILRSSFSVAGANYYRVPDSPLEPLLVAQAAEPDAAKRAQIVAQAQKTLDQQHFWVPVAELTTVLGVAGNVHGIAFDASSRIQLHDAWKPAS